MQGFAQAIYDLVGNDMILKLWSGISASPINAMHSGYGIGAIVAILASKNFIVFSDYDLLLAKANSSNVVVPSVASSVLVTNSTISSSNVSIEKTGWEKINVQTPYWIAGKFSLFVGILFLITQIFETKVCEFLNQ